ncbi:hypothetical protein CP533_5435 [Ophiocordyceps camponoti-saundersi (nom. inval.)]|nr:hypothetical protein CP533_5435 [Ophiocordyceps camponoti-saundersi (nom. inval.)]
MGYVMLPSSLRRAVTAVPLLSTGLGSALAPAAPLIACSPQRRYSSSKPSRPDNDAKDVPADGSVAASPASSRSEGKAGGDKRKRKSKDVSLKKLPFVPETDHMTANDICLSSFFSQHRPISITQSIPNAVTKERFAAIFTSRVKNNRPITPYSDNRDLVATSMSQMTIASNQQHQQYQQHDEECKIDVVTADGIQSSIYRQIEAMAGEFSPYRLPPVPQPAAAAEVQLTAVSEVQSTATADAAGEVAPIDEPQHRKYRAIFTIEETIETDGQYRVVAHSPRIVRGNSEPSFLERLARRQLRFDESRSRPAMHALSVRRQRKLKMKKKKYKKLQKRMRTLRNRNI